MIRKEILNTVNDIYLDYHWILQGIKDDIKALQNEVDNQIEEVNLQSYTQLQNNITWLNIQTLKIANTLTHTSKQLERINPILEEAKNV